MKHKLQNVLLVIGFWSVLAVIVIEFVLYALLSILRSDYLYSGKGLIFILQETSRTVIRSINLQFHPSIFYLSAFLTVLIGISYLAYRLVRNKLLLCKVLPGIVIATGFFTYISDQTSCGLFTQCLGGLLFFLNSFIAGATIAIVPVLYVVSKHSNANKILLRTLPIGLLLIVGSLAVLLISYFPFLSKIAKSNIADAEELRSLERQVTIQYPGYMPSHVSIGRLNYLHDGAIEQYYICGDSEDIYTRKTFSISQTPLSQTKENVSDIKTKYTKPGSGFGEGVREGWTVLEEMEINGRPALYESDIFHTVYWEDDTTLFKLSYAAHQGDCLSKEDMLRIAASMQPDPNSQSHDPSSVIMPNTIPVEL